MFPVPEQQWGLLSAKTWDYLSPHYWECFRLGLAETNTEVVSSNVAIVHVGALAETVSEIKAHGVRVEFSPAIAETKVEMVANIVVSKRDYKTAMLNYLPWYERESKVFNSILDAYDKEFRGIEQSVDLVKRNMFLDTAVEALDMHERDLGIDIIKTLSYRQRREQILSRNMANLEQTTEETIKSVAKAYSNGEVEVNPTLTAGLYEIKFVGTKGIPDNLDGLKAALAIIIPAHLGIKYTFVYNPWEILKNITWGDCLPKTWDSLRVWEEAI